MGQLMAPQVILVGLPGSGKTTIGRRLAKELNVQLRDSDSLIEKMYKGRPCGEILSTLGEKDFRTVEAQIIASALEEDGVLSLGGGAVVTPATRERLKQHTVVFLDISVDEGVARTSRLQTRPLLDVPNPREKYQQLYDQRRNFYQEVSTFSVLGDKRNIHDVTREIMQKIAG